MDELVVDGEKYISSKRAARLSGYAKDYIGQLCRAGKIDAKMVGRSWYVKESAIKEHRKTFQGQPVIDDALWVEGKDGVEFKGFGTTAEPAKPRLTEEHIKINYEHDDRPVIPMVERKPEVSVPSPSEKAVEADEEVHQIPDVAPEEPDEIPHSDSHDLDQPSTPAEPELEVEDEPIVHDRTSPVEVHDTDEIHERRTSSAALRARGGHRTRLGRYILLGVVVAVFLVVFLESRSVYVSTDAGFERTASGVGLWNPVEDVRAMLARE